jgi:hypothetical protein
MSRSQQQHWQTYVLVRFPLTNTCFIVLEIKASLIMVIKDINIIQIAYVYIRYQLSFP